MGEPSPTSLPTKAHRALRRLGDARSAQPMISGSMTMEEITAKAETDAILPQPRSGKQEQIENLLMRSIYSAQL